MSELNFLVVEDSPTMRQLISFSLKRFRNAKVVEATDGVDALKKLNEGRFNLIVCDINMPLMDGLKLLSIIRKNPEYDQVPVVMVTTEGSEVDKEKGLSLGANAYLPKPIQTSDLVRVIRDLLKVEE